MLLNIRVDPCVSPRLLSNLPAIEGRWEVPLEISGGRKRRNRPRPMHSPDIDCHVRAGLGKHVPIRIRAQDRYRLRS